MNGGFFMKKKLICFLTLLSLVFVLNVEISFAGNYDSGNGIVFDSDEKISADCTYKDDIYIKRGTVLTIENGCTVTFEGNVYIFGTLINYGTIINSKTTYCLDYNGFIAAGKDYGYGYLKNHGNFNGGTLTANDSYLSTSIPTPTPTQSPTHTPTPAQTVAPTKTPTSTPIPTVTPMPTSTPIPTAEPTEKPIHTEAPTVTIHTEPTEIQTSTHSTFEVPNSEHLSSQKPKTNDLNNSDKNCKGKLQANKKIIKIKKNGKYKLKVKKINVKGKLKYVSSKKNIAIINSNGVIKTKKRGRCYITVKCKNIKLKIFIIVTE